MSVLHRLLSAPAAPRVPTAAGADSSAQDVAAVNAVVQAMATAVSSREAVQAALDVVRSRFGWDYGSCWRVWATDGALHFDQESGEVSEVFRAVTQQATFTQGVGLSGRAWAQRDLVFVSDLAELADCVRAPAARAAGVVSGICFPLLQDGQVVGTIDFFATLEERAQPAAAGHAAHDRRHGVPGDRTRCRHGRATPGRT